MATTAARRCIPAVLLCLVTVGCGTGQRPSIDSSAGAAVTVATVDTPLPAGTTDIPITPGTSDIPVTPISADVPVPPIVSSDMPSVVSIDAVVGVSTGPSRLETVQFGSTIALSISNPTSDDEFHLHGYELGDGVTVPAGQIQTFTFTADQLGEFELESHETGAVLLTLSVT
jgi:hypothetical protein